jgi:hypothetical protein
MMKAHAPGASQSQKNRVNSATWCNQLPIRPWAHSHSHCLHPESNRFLLTERRLLRRGGGDTPTAPTSERRLPPLTKCDRKPAMRRLVEAEAHGLSFSFLSTFF